MDINDLAPEDKNVYCQAPWRVWTQMVERMAKKVQTSHVFDNFVKWDEVSSQDGVLVTKFLP